MRLAAAALFALLSLFAAANGSALAKEPAALPDREVEFDGKTLKLAWQGENPELPVEEFIPADETLEKWTQLASIRRFPDLDDAKGLAATTLETVSESYPGAPTNMVEKPDSDEAIIEFVVESPKESPAEPFVEYNLFKYAKDPNGGVIAQQYALRTYGDKAKFLKHLKEVRQGLLDEMAEAGLQEKK